MIEVLVHDSRTDKPGTMRDPETGKVYAFDDLRLIGPDTDGNHVLVDIDTGKQFRCAPWFYDCWRIDSHRRT